MTNSEPRIKKWLISAVLLVLAIGPVVLAADNKTGGNSLGIDNTCYVLYKEVERQLGKEGFVPAAELLRQAAIERKDDKALVIYHMEILKDLLARPISEDNDARVDEARENLKQIAREKNQPSYFYRAYHLSQEYYTKHGEAYRALLLLQEMQEKAIADNDAYGIWTSSKYLADIYIRHNDYISAKPHIKQAIKLYNTTDDPTIRRESPTRLYCDLADTYPIASDSVRINVMLGWAAAKTHMDSLRCRYYRLRLAALDDNQKEYLRLRNLCAKDPDFPAITSDAELFFSLIDASRDGTIMQREDEIYNLATVREMKVIANLCENHGYQEFAFSVEKKLVNLMEALISNTNLSRISELDVTMGKGEYRISYEEGEKNFICEAAISSAEHRLQPGVKMYYKPEDPAPMTFRTDPGRVQQVLINLLTNSCKHTAQGEIVLSSSIDENPGFVTFSVTDTGTGVPPEQAEKIFDRFTKLDEFVQGTGLGLSICRDIASRMGARVALDTTHPGPGARFVFIVPINPSEE